MTVATKIKRSKTAENAMVAYFMKELAKLDYSSAKAFARGAEIIDTRAVFDDSDESVEITRARGNNHRFSYVNGWKKYS